MIAVSTAWNAARHRGWEPAARELLALGFPSVALDGPAVQADAAAAGRAVREAKGAVAALFAPGPSRDPASPVDGGGLVDVREDRRAPAVVAAVAAARAALAAGTRVVVLRPGTIPVLDGSREDRWTARLGREGATPDLVAEVAAARAELGRDRSRFLESLCRSLWEVSRAVPDAELAVESPASVAGLPFPADVEPMLGELRGRRVALWLDTAHAARLGMLGAADPREWLAVAGPVTSGITLSDWSPPVLAAGGGRPPFGAGIVDWTAVRAQVSATMTRVLRVGAEYAAPLVAESLRAATSRGF